MSARQRKILLAGLAILAASVCTGIYLSFQRWDRGSPYDASSWNSYNPLGRATYGPLMFAFYLLPITLTVVLLIGAVIYLGMKREKLWPLSLLGFIGMGVLWVLFVTSLWEID